MHVDDAGMDSLSPEELARTSNVVGQRKHPGPHPPERVVVTLDDGRQLLVLRPFFPEDRATFEQAILDSQALLAGTLTWHDADGRQFPDTSWDAIAACVADDYSTMPVWDNDTGYFWKIIDANTGMFLGSIDVWPLEHGGYNLGYWRAAYDEARGIMLPVARELADACFSHAGIDSMILTINDTNQASIAIARGLGAQCEDPDLQAPDVPAGIRKTLWRFGPHELERARAWIRS